jgi:hypothetical protein
MLALPLLLPLVFVFANVTPVAVAQGGHHVQPPPPPLPALPVVARIRVDVAKDRVLVVHEIVMSRGTWAGGDIDVFVAFGPTLPRALDAHLLAVAPNASAPDPNDIGEPLPHETAAHRPSHAHPLLGRSAMAGEVLHIREPAFRRATAGSGQLAIRIRQVLAPPASDAQHAHEIVVRLGMESGPPLAVRHIELSTPESGGWLGSASAQLCGPSADPYSIGFSIAPRGIGLVPMAVDPTSTTRRTTDDLCVRYVTPRD